jgi:hypothetical protein
VNWNVYKIFKNGKRAKAPMATFEYNDKADLVVEYFESEIKKNFNEKNRDLNFLIFREDEPQERKEKEKFIEEDLRKQTFILNRRVRALNLKSKYRIVGGLIFAGATDWQWQWCALQGGTNKYIAGLSPPFNNPSEAQEWMNQQIQNLR